MRSLSKVSNDTGSRAAAFNRGSDQTAVQQFSKVTQLKTVIKHKTGKLNVLNVDRTVGKAMEADLDPKDPVKGSATGVNSDWMQSIRKSYKNANVVRGHLLNHDLGGFAIEENLYPISTKANADHSKLVEQKVKGQLTLADQNNGRVKYTVKVNESDSFRKAAFNCEWKTFNQNNVVVKQDSQSILSDLGKDKGGFGGGRKAEKSPITWRHGKNKGGTEVKSIKKLVDKAKQNSQLLFEDGNVDHGGMQEDDDVQDWVEWLNDYVDERGYIKTLVTLRNIGKKNKSLKTLSDGLIDYLRKNR